MRRHRKYKPAVHARRRQEARRMRQCDAHAVLETGHVNGCGCPDCGEVRAQFALDHKL